MSTKICRAKLTVLRHPCKYNLRCYSSAISSHASTTLPIPGKHALSLSTANSNALSTKQTLESAPNQNSAVARLPWQPRTVTLAEQCHILPSLIVARIEVLSNAKIAIAPQTTASPVHNTTDASSSSSSMFSSFYPSQYYQVTMTGDANAVDAALQIYIYYTQTAIPIVLETNIPGDILDVISKEHGCFLVKQNSFVHRLYPSTLQTQKSESEHMQRIQREIRASIHKLSVPETWREDAKLMQWLFLTLKRHVTHSNIGLKSGGYFWYDSPPIKNEDDAETDTDAVDQSEIGGNQSESEFVEFESGRHIWLYQNAQNTANMDLTQTLQNLIDSMTQKWRFYHLTQNTRPILNARKGFLWQRIQSHVRENIDARVQCRLTDDSILWRVPDAFEADSENDKEQEIRQKFEQFMQQRILEHIVYMDVNTDLSDAAERELHRICHSCQLPYIIPSNKAFVTYFVDAEKYNSEQSGKIKLAIRELIDPLHTKSFVNKMMEENVDIPVVKKTSDSQSSSNSTISTKKIPKSSQNSNVQNLEQKCDHTIRIENSEKYHVFIRMLQQLTQTEPEIVQKFANDGNQSETAAVFYTINAKQRSIDFTFNGEENDVRVQTAVDRIYFLLNQVSSVSVPLPILLLLRANRGHFTDTIEQRFEMILGAPALKDVPAILFRHFSQRRMFISKKSGTSSSHNVDDVFAKMFFFTQNPENVESIQAFLNAIIYEHIDLEIPMHLLYKQIGDDNQPKTDGSDRENNAIAISQRLTQKFGLLNFTNHATKYAKNAQNWEMFQNFYPKANDSRYWLFADVQNKTGILECMQELRGKLSECKFIDLADLNALVGFLQTVPNLLGTHGLSDRVGVYRNVTSGKVFCFASDSAFEIFKEKLQSEMEKLRKHVLSIDSDAYGDIAIFHIAGNFKRIQNLIQSQSRSSVKGFLWFSDAQRHSQQNDVLNIYCEDSGILRGVENDVVANIASHSRVCFWNDHFTVPFSEYVKNKDLQERLAKIVKDTKSEFVIRTQRPITPALAITNYDKYELDVAYTKIMNLLNAEGKKTHSDSNTGVQKDAEASQTQKHFLPKPIILT